MPSKYNFSKKELSKYKLNNLYKGIHNKDIIVFIINTVIVLPTSTVFPFEE